MTTSKRTALLFLIGGVTCFILAAIMVWRFSGKFGDSGPTVVAGPIPVAEKKDNVQSGRTDEEQTKWMIYITGAVRSPGVYEVPCGARVYQAVDQAGGLTVQADRVAVNLAMIMADGMHVHIPSEQEVLSKDADGAGYIQNSPLISDTSAVGQDKSEIKTKIDINRADNSDLQSLKGIGPKTADSIISYRRKYGPFRSIEELLKVKGIGPKKLDSIRDCIMCNP